MTDALQELNRTLSSLIEHKKFNKLAFYKPYPKQLELHAIIARERMLRAGNQEGKTYCAAAEVSYHLTGKYPDWWKGIRFDHPILVWAAGEDSTVVRDRMQSLLCGKYGIAEEKGTGFIPKDDILDVSMSRGVTDAFDTVTVQHWKLVDGKYEKDGFSSLRFKSYEQGRKKFQSDAVDFIWLDEEPDEDIYSECVTRTTATGGYILVTFTPLQGRTPMLSRYMEFPNEQRREVVMTIYDALHIPREKIPGIIAAWPEHERDARAYGIPMMGEGRVFPFADDVIEEDDIVTVPVQWTRLWSIDFGTGGTAHPFAGTLILWDKDADCLHVHKALKTDEQLVSQHCMLIKQIAEQVRVAWPHDGNQKERGAADETMTTQKLYKKGGLRMLPEHATFEDGGISTEAGILEMYERMKSGKLKIAKSLMRGETGIEFRNYHRKDGKIVKVSDDIMSCIRIGVMMKRKGDNSPLGPSIFPGGGDKNKQTRELADGVDFDLFA